MIFFEWSIFIQMISLQLLVGYVLIFIFNNLPVVLVSQPLLIYICKKKQSSFKSSSISSQLSTVFISRRFSFIYVCVCVCIYIYIYIYISLYIHYKNYKNVYIYHVYIFDLLQEKGPSCFWNLIQKYFTKTRLNVVWLFPFIRFG